MRETERSGERKQFFFSFTQTHTLPLPSSPKKSYGRGFKGYKQSKRGLKGVTEGFWVYFLVVLWSVMECYGSLLHDPFVLVWPPFVNGSSFGGEVMYSRRNYFRDAGGTKGSL